MLRLPTTLRLEYASPLSCLPVLPDLHLPNARETRKANSEKLFSSFQLNMQTQVWVSPAQGGIVEGWRGKASSESDGLGLTTSASISGSLHSAVQSLCRMNLGHAVISS